MVSVQQSMLARVYLSMFRDILSLIRTYTKDNADTIIENLIKFHNSKKINDYNVEISARKWLLSAWKMIGRFFAVFIYTFVFIFNQ